MPSSARLAALFLWGLTFGCSLSTTPSYAADRPEETASTDANLALRPELAAFIEERVTQDGFDRAELFRLFDQAVQKPKIIEIFDRPTTSRPWYQYHPNVLNPKQIAEGVAFSQKYAPVLQAAEAKYGVPAPVIAAILGVETRYGRNAGSFRVFDVLVTLAFDYPRRADYFKTELRSFLVLARAEKRDPLTFKGSYAGAMGWPQFMPSSFTQYAVDGDGDGQRDIWRNPTDIIFSVAHYLAEFGWERGGPLMQSATIKGDMSELLADKFNLHYTVADLFAKGVTPNQAVPDTSKAVVFSLEDAPGTFSYWLGFNNFYVITRYNKSTLYTMSVIQLADAINAAVIRDATQIATP